VQLLDATTLKRIRITTELQDPLGLVAGDEGELSHALMNLCLNALDAMPGTGTLVIRTRRLAGGAIELSVQDDGEGMSPEVLKQAIDPFFTTKPVGKGTGLGLAMVYGTVKAHGGTFDIHSEPGKGTEVMLGFPPIPETGPALPGQGVEQGQDPASARRGMRILLVDDDELIRLSLPAMLQALGHEVHTEEGGLEALASLEAGLEVDLVILDLTMPGLSGAETLPRMLALRPGLPVLLSTGYADQEIKHLMADRPNVGVIWKPFSLDELRGKLESLRGRPAR
jgi:CheY-like chemotaxis protein